MPVWQKSFDLAFQVFGLTANLPRSEDYSLTSQIRRSSSSIPSNISEAFGRSTNKDKVHFYIIARGSAYETQNHLLYGVRVGYFDNKKAEFLINEYDSLIHDINKIIKTLNN